MVSATATQPNLFIVGAPKCGTTSLYHYLETHPQVYFSGRKEPRYWCSDLTVRRNRSSQQFRDLGEYLELFSGAPAEAAVVAEASTLYLRSKVAVPRILAFNPAARFIVMVRNPIDMFHSWHNYLLNQFVEDVAEPRRAWQLQSERRAGRHLPSGCDVPAKLQYRDMISLGEQVAELAARVPPEQFLVVVNEDLAADPSAEYHRVLEFLGLPDDGRQDFPHANQAAVYRSRWLAQRLHAPPVWLVRSAGWMRKRCPVAFPPGFRGRLLDRLRRQQQKPELAEEFRRELAAEMASDVHRLGELLRRDLNHWLSPAESGVRNIAEDV